MSTLAWLVNMDVGLLGHEPSADMRKHRPTVLFYPLVRGGWRVLPWHLHHHNYASCQSLRSYYVRAPGHTKGALIPY